MCCYVMLCDAMCLARSLEYEAQRHSNGLQPIPYRNGLWMHVGFGDRRPAAL